MSTNGKSKAQLWTRNFKNRQRKLQDILSFLNAAEYTDAQEDNTLTDNQLRELGIELVDLDLKTEQSSLSAIPYFMPDHNGAL